METKCSRNLHYIEVILMRKPSVGDYGLLTGHPSQAVAKTFFFLLLNTFSGICLTCFVTYRACRLSLVVSRFAGV